MAFLPKVILILQIIAYSSGFFYDFARRSIKANLVARQYKQRATASENKEQPHIVIIGASFAGYHAAKILAESLPAASPYRIVVIEPNSHFQFTWLLPRFSVVSGHESKLFIPYGPYIKHNKERVRWVRDRAIEITKTEVRLRDSKEMIPWSFLVIATGSGQTNGLPSRVGIEDRTDGITALQGLQQQIKAAQDVVVVGGGAVGVELAADAKETYPEKNITLVHSRKALMHRFEPGLQATARKALEALKVHVILEDRVLEHLGGQSASLKSGGTVKCDLLVDCVGQRPEFNLISNIAAGAIAPSGHIKVKPTLQIEDDTLPHVYVCGDVADIDIPKPNARAAMMQATIVADNIVKATQGKKPDNAYKPHWIEGIIKLTLGLTKSVVHFANGSTELLRHGIEKKITLMADETWTAMGVHLDAPEV